jgi:hypothetical protein
MYIFSTENQPNVSLIVIPIPLRSFEAAISAGHAGPLKYRHPVHRLNSSRGKLDFISEAKTTSRLADRSRHPHIKINGSHCPNVGTPSYPNHEHGAEVTPICPLPGQTESECPTLGQ